MTGTPTSNVVVHCQKRSPQLWGRGGGEPPCYSKGNKAVVEEQMQMRAAAFAP